MVQAQLSQQQLDDGRESDPNNVLAGVRKVLGPRPEQAVRQKGLRGGLVLAGVKPLFGEAPLLLHRGNRLDRGWIKDVHKVLQRGWSTDLKVIRCQALAHIAAQVRWPDVKPGSVAAKPDAVLVKLRPHTRETLEDIGGLRHSCA